MLKTCLHCIENYSKLILGQGYNMLPFSLCTHIEFEMRHLKITLGFNSRLWQKCNISYSGITYYLLFVYTHPYFGSW